jgi:hypothetical protein
VRPHVGRVLFVYVGYQGSLLSFRNPLLHSAQIRKLTCVSHDDYSIWYRHLNQVLIHNAFDETAAAMASSDYDGDMNLLTKLFTDKFEQSDFIVFNNNDITNSQEKTVLTEKLVQRSIRANLSQNLLGVICNINTRALELLNDKKSLQKFVSLVAYKNDVSFGFDSAQIPYFPKFKDIPTAEAYLEKLNLELSVMAELEVDRPKTNYHNRFSQNQQEYSLPYTPYWFGNVKGYLCRHTAYRH